MTLYIRRYICMYVGECILPTALYNDNDKDEQLASVFASQAFRHLLIDFQIEELMASNVTNEMEH
jgi:hypothetical protein